MACRSLEKAKASKNSIERTCEDCSDVGTIVTVRLDLASFKSVRECAQHILDTELQLNILVNNAGVVGPKRETEDGFEVQFGYKIDFDDINFKKRNYNAFDAYSQSKLANILFSRELAAKLKEHHIEGVNTYSLHPGLIKNNFVRETNVSFILRAIWLLKKIPGPFIKTPKLAAQTTIYCAVDEKCANETGLYYSDCSVVSPSAKALNNEYSKKLWEKSLELVGLQGEDPFTAEVTTS